MILQNHGLHTILSLFFTSTENGLKTLYYLGTTDKVSNILWLWQINYTWGMIDQGQATWIHRKILWWKKSGTRLWHDVNSTWKKSEKTFAHPPLLPLPFFSPCYVKIVSLIMPRVSCNECAPLNTTVRVASFPFCSPRFSPTPNSRVLRPNNTASLVTDGWMKDKQSVTLSLFSPTSLFGTRNETSHV